MKKIREDMAWVALVLFLLLIGYIFLGCDTEHTLIDIIEPIETKQPLALSPNAVNTCPPTLYKNISRMRHIPQGTFTMGCENSPANRFAPKIVLETEAYYIDMHEITNSDFMLFVELTGYQPDNDICDAPQITDVDFYALPALVSWNDANSYAKWVGKRLPTEIEWEKAARAGNNTVFSWGNNQPTLAPIEKQDIVIVGLGPAQRTSMANEGAFAVHLLSGDIGGRDARHYEKVFKAVCSYMPNAYGLFDMIGNASEWCANEWNNNAYLFYSSNIEPVWDGKYYLDANTHTTALSHVVRGGGSMHSIDAYNTWHANFETLSEELRYRYIRRTIHVGEREARSATQKAGFRLVIDIPNTAQVFCVKE